jgi:hypothetical protein
VPVFSLILVDGRDGWCVVPEELYAGNSVLGCWLFIDRTWALNGFRFVLGLLGIVDIFTLETLDIWYWHDWNFYTKFMVWLAPTIKMWQFVGEYKHFQSCEYPSIMYLSRAVYLSLIHSNMYNQTLPTTLNRFLSSLTTQ